MELKTGVPFDPGFVQHMSAFMPNIEYVYSSLSQFKNFSQKKQQFKMYFPKIQNLLKNYIGFYLGCIMWAVYIKQEDAPILNNLCYGGEYSEEETLSEVNFIKEYLGQLKKDVKYYMGQEFSIDENYEKIITAYSEFLKLNEGFVKTEKTSDIKIPANIKIQTNLEELKIEIDKVIENGKLYELIPFSQKVI